MMYSKKYFVIVLFFSVLLTLSADNEIRKFDFGTDKSATQKGFIKVTSRELFSNKRGYGFKHTNTMSGADRKNARKQLPRGLWKGVGKVRIATDISSDFLEDRKDNTFSVALPDGDYRVWFLACDTLWAPQFFQVWANGEKKLDVKIPRREFVFLKPFNARSENGILNIEFRGDKGWLAGGLIIGKKGQELDQTIAALKKDLYLFPDEDDKLWKEYKREPVRKEPALNPEQKKKAYVCFSKDYTELIYPYTKPETSEITTDIESFASPGEFEPVSLCVYPLKDLGEMNISVSDFVSEDGKIIPKKNIKTEITRYQGLRPNYYSHQEEYFIGPRFLIRPDGDINDIRKGETKQLWFTVRLPEKVSPGFYNAKITLSPEYGEVQNVNWKLLVLPIKLKKPDNKFWCSWLPGFPPLMYIRGPSRRGRNTETEQDRLSRSEMKEFVAHGYNMAIIHIIPHDVRIIKKPDGGFSFKTETFLKTMDFLKPLGNDSDVIIGLEALFRDFQKKYAEIPTDENTAVFSPKAKKAIVAFVKYLKELSEKNNWPGIYYYPIDEPGNNKTKNRFEFARNVLDMVHEVPGCRTAVTVTPECLQKLGKQRIDLPIFGLRNTDIEKIAGENPGKTVMFYENDIYYGNDPVLSRGLYGVDFLRSGAAVASAWGLCDWAANPFNSLDHAHLDGAVMLPGADELTSSVYWELCREGIDDCRYIGALQALCKELRKEGQNEKASEGEAILSSILGTEFMTTKNPKQFQRYRWRIAREILRLSGKNFSYLGKPEKADAEVSSWSKNLLENNSFEKGPQQNGLPGGAYVYNDNFSRDIKDPSGAILVSGDKVRSGRFSMKWDFAKAKKEKKGYFVRSKTRPTVHYLVINIKIPEDILEEIKGKEISVGMWVKSSDSEAKVNPRLCLRQYLKNGKLEAVCSKNTICKPDDWNNYQLTAEIKSDIRKMDIHLACRVPDDMKLCKKTNLFFDDFYLKVRKPGVLMISSPLEDYYIGEKIPYEISLGAAFKKVDVALCLNGKEIFGETLNVKNDKKTDGFIDSSALKPGIYSLKAEAVCKNGKKELSYLRNIFITERPSL